MSFHGLPPEIPGFLVQCKGATRAVDILGWDLTGENKVHGTFNELRICDISDTCQCDFLSVCGLRSCIRLKNSLIVLYRRLFLTEDDSEDNTAKRRRQNRFITTKPSLESSCSFFRDTVISTRGVIAYPGILA
jgi:hypothetical protein